MRGLGCSMGRDGRNSPFPLEFHQSPSYSFLAIYNSRLATWRDAVGGPAPRTQGPAGCEPHCRFACVCGRRSWLLVRRWRQLKTFVPGEAIAISCVECRSACWRSRVFRRRPRTQLATGTRTAPCPRAVAMGPGIRPVRYGAPTTATSWAPTAPGTTPGSTTPSSARRRPAPRRASARSR